MNILVVGGAGYIGSHMLLMLSKTEHNLFVLDNLSQGHRDSVISGEFVYGDLSDPVFLDKFFLEHNFDAVMHFASYIQVGESVINPGKYYDNNISNTINLLNAMVSHKVNKLIFSSSAAIFGNPEYLPIDEDHPANPTSPYGYSKLVVENILRDYDKAYNLKSVCLRYFNAAGADPYSSIGEKHNPETHLIPLVLQVASERMKKISIYGNDYKTQDGTCIRDYIHVMDICNAHLLALDYLIVNNTSNHFNLGNQTGYSVMEVIKTVENVTKKRIKLEICPKRHGDPDVLVADNKKACRILNWRPEFSDLNTIIKHAWSWEKTLNPSSFE